MPFRYHGFALAFALLAGPAGAFAQLPKDHPSEIQAQLVGPDVFTVTRVDADGTIVLGPSPTVPAQFRDNLGTFFPEGYYLLVTNDGQPAGKRRVIRAQVTDIAAGSVFTLKTGPQAAARVQIKDSARFVRPVPATTAGLRALPDEIAFQVKPNDAKTDDEARENAVRARSINHLTRIGVAIYNFYTVYNALPPAVIYGPDGKPWHSWRVLILPWLENVKLDDAYDFSQPWDSPKNQALIDKMPAVFHDPVYGDVKDANTHYAALVGPRSVFPPEGVKQTDPKNPPFGKGSADFRKITDGKVNTVMLSSVEPGRKIPWTKPEDIDVGPAFKGFGQPGGIAAPYTFRGPGGGKAAPFLFCDGSVRFIGATVNPRTLEALMTCSGGEIIPADSYPVESRPSVPQVKTLKIRLDGGKATASIE